MRVVVVLAVAVAAAGCGRWGFAEPIDATESIDGSDEAGAPGDADLDVAAPKPDAALALDDAPLSPDAPPGMGGYTVSKTTGTFAPLAGAMAVPGFAPKNDEETFTVALPFAFPFYRVMFTSVHINVNGYVTFEAGPTGVELYNNDCPMDGTPPGAMIAAFWDDLYATDVAPAASLTYAVAGVAPDRTFTVEWKDFDAFYMAGGGNNAFAQGVRVTHQIVLRENGTIELRYGPRTPPTSSNKDCGADRHRGCSATVGLEAPGSMLFDAIQCGTAAGPGPGYTPIDDGKIITLAPT